MRKTTVFILISCLAISCKTTITHPEQGACESGVYRNMLAEAGISQSDIDNRLEQLWNQYFNPADSNRVYYPVGTDEAYIFDTGNNDVRSEGMSYGLMICVQTNHQTEFNRLWKWAKTHMQHKPGTRFDGYFAWQLNSDGIVMSDTPASDGEEYFITALMFASNRWGDGEGIYNYRREANDLLNHCMKRSDSADRDSVFNLFNSTQKQITFCPCDEAAAYTDPSYHLPAFYELWGEWDGNVTRRQFWKDCAAKSREMFVEFADETTGLMPDYADFSGKANPLRDGAHADFQYDSWRCMMNMGIDYAWFKGSDNERILANKILSFFNEKGRADYADLWHLNGEQKGTDHSIGLIACNAGGALASDSDLGYDFVRDFHNTAMPTGIYRYYNGLLYYFNYLLLSGNYRIYKPNLSSILKYNT